MAPSIGQTKLSDFIKTYHNLYHQLCSTENLVLAFRKASTKKTAKIYVMLFEQNFKQNIRQLQTELLTQSYNPAPLTTFIVRDPKTRKINASDFRDRIVHHALCNIIGPIFEKQFIHDSFANQKGKGTHKAVLRFEKFMRQTRSGYVLKADVRHYFDSVDHNLLFQIIERKIKDPKIMWLIRTIISSYCVENIGKGMPIGNLTSQFFANVFLNELDQYVKHTLKVKRYIRYVDDFVLLSEDRAQLETLKNQIDAFLTSLKLQLHPDKSRITLLSSGTTFLGYRVFPTHRLLKKSNQRRIFIRVARLSDKVERKVIIEREAILSLAGWLAYARHADTFKLRKSVIRAFEGRTIYHPDKISPISIQVKEWMSKQEPTSYLS